MMLSSIDDVRYLVLRFISIYDDRALPELLLYHLSMQIVLNPSATNLSPELPSIHDNTAVRLTLRKEQIRAL